MSLREVTESPKVQGEDESIKYSLTTTPWGSSPTSVAVTLWDITDAHNWTNVSGTSLSGATSTNSDIITTPSVLSLTRDKTYRLEIKFTAGGNIYEPYLILYGEA